MSAQYQRLRAAGLCVRCRKEVAVKGKTRCVPCSLQDRTQYNKQRDVVYAAYGGACACCGETEPLFLTLDHVNNDGAVQRKSVRPEQLYRWVIGQGFPNDLQLLCWNCNCGRARNNGVCPHKNQDK